MFRNPLLQLVSRRVFYFAFRVHILGGSGAALKAAAENQASCKTIPTTRLHPPTSCRTFTVAHNTEPHRTVHSTMSTTRTWTVKFEGVAQPEAFRQRLLKSPFFRCAESPSVSIESTALTFTFSSSTLDRNGVNEKCTQTFCAYGAYERHSIVEQAPASTYERDKFRSRGARSRAHACHAEPGGGRHCARCWHEQARVTQRRRLLRLALLGADASAADAGPVAHPACQGCGLRSLPRPGCGLGGGTRRPCGVHCRRH